MDNSLTNGNTAVELTAFIDFRAYFRRMLNQYKGRNMPYHSKSELPEPVRNVLPAHAQTIYLESFNSAWDTYKEPKDRKDSDDRETTAHKVAWSAVKHKYEKQKDGSWRKQQ